MTSLVDDIIKHEPELQQERAKVEKILDELWHFLDAQTLTADERGMIKQRILSQQTSAKPQWHKLRKIYASGTLWVMIVALWLYTMYKPAIEIQKVKEWLDGMEVQREDIIEPVIQGEWDIISSVSDESDDTDAIMTDDSSSSSRPQDGQNSTSLWDSSDADSSDSTDAAESAESAADQALPSDDDTSSDQAKTSSDSDTDNDSQADDLSSDTSSDISEEGDDTTWLLGETRSFDASEDDQSEDEERWSETADVAPLSENNDDASVSDGGDASAATTFSSDLWDDQEEEIVTDPMSVDISSDDTTTDTSEDISPVWDDMTWDQKTSDSDNVADHTNDSEWSDVESLDGGDGDMVDGDPSWDPDNDGNDNPDMGEEPDVMTIETAYSNEIARYNECMASKDLATIEECLQWWRAQTGIQKDFPAVYQSMAQQLQALYQQLQE